MSISNLLTPENLVSAPIEQGDAGVVLKADGTFRVFSTGALDGKDLTPAQRAQGEKLLALAVALKFPDVMSILVNMSRDPDIVGETFTPGTLN